MEYFNGRIKRRRKRKGKKKKERKIGTQYFYSILFSIPSFIGILLNIETKEEREIKTSKRQIQNR